MEERKIHPPNNTFLECYLRIYEGNWFSPEANQNYNELKANKNQRKRHTLEYLCLS